MRVRRFTNDQARRIALAAQGFNEPRPTGRIDVRHFRRVLRRIGLLQLDSVNVLARSHYLPMFSRLGGYERSALDRWTAGSGEVYEYWGHEASLLPIDTYPLFRFRMDAMRPGAQARQVLDEKPGYVDSVYEQVATRGPLEVGDLDEPGERSGPWWGHPPGKTALEWLFASGTVTAFRTATFARRYDLPERVIPDPWYTHAGPDRRGAYRELLLRAAEHHGIGSAADLADYHRLHTPTARTVLADLAAEGRLTEVDVAGWRGPAYLHPHAVLPRRSMGTALLSPFDSLVWARDRVERVFGFRYRIEIYVPKPKRRYGYYVLPFLFDGELVARVDIKADRGQQRLVVRAAHVEDAHDPRRVSVALAQELTELARWLDLSEIEVDEIGDLAGPLTVALS